MNIPTLNVKLVIICVIILIIIYSFPSNNTSSILAGVWEGDPRFCVESEIKDFYIYIDEFEI